MTPICNHEKKEVRVVTFTNGTKHYFEQCLTCGVKVGHAIPHAYIKGSDNIKPFDTELNDRYEQARREEYEARAEEKSEAWWSDYNEYLKSAEWNAVRRQVLERDQYLCQGCRCRKATQVHHMTYKHVKAELLFELVSVCDRCHEKIHDGETAD